MRRFQIGWASRWASNEIGPRPAFSKVVKTRGNFGDPNVRQLEPGGWLVAWVGKTPKRSVTLRDGRTDPVVGLGATAVGHTIPSAPTGWGGSR